MATAKDSSPLSNNVHQALQNAISEANNVVGESHKKKRKKRPSATTEVTQPVTQPIPEEAEEERQNRPKKKKKSSKNVNDGSAEQIDALAVEAALEVATPDSGSEQVVEASPTDIVKKKKKQDGKGKGKASGPTEGDIDPQLSGQTSSNEFLNAVVTAAAQQMNHSQDQSPSHHSYQPFPYNPASYPAHTMQSVTQQQQQQSFMPVFNAMGQTAFPLPESLFTNLGNSSNEDVLRAVQDLDLTKIASVLRNMGETPSNSLFPLPGQASTSQQQQSINHPPILPRLPNFQNQPVPSRSQIPAPSNLILGQPPRNSSKPPQKKKVPVTTTMPLAGPDYNPEHAHLLANKWMNANKLAELVKTKGLVYKKGKFSAAEEQALTESIEKYRISHGITEEQVNELIFAKTGKGKDTAFWSEITAQIPQRPIIAVYHHVRRAHHPLKQQGKWMPAEDEYLRQAVAEHGQMWEKVSLKVGRMASDCRDRWRNHINHRDQRVTGPWTKEEEDLLTKIVSDMTIAQGKDQDNDVFWGIVSDRMGNRRGRQQCRIKWTDSLSKMVKNEGHKPRWSQQDAYILVHKIASLNVRDDSEIDWKLLSDDDWNLWSAHSLQRRWLTLKRSVRGHEEMSHQEIMDILRVKKAHTLPSPAPIRKNRVTSATIVPFDASELVAPQPGPSTIASGLAQVAALGPIAEVATEEVESAASGANENDNEQDEDNTSTSSSSSGSSDDDSSDSD